MCKDPPILTSQKPSTSCALSVAFLSAARVFLHIGLFIYYYFQYGPFRFLMQLCFSFSYYLPIWRRYHENLLLIFDTLLFYYLLLPFEMYITGFPILLILFFFIFYFIFNFFNSSNDFILFIFF